MSLRDDDKARREKASGWFGTVGLVVAVFAATPALAIQYEWASLPVPEFGLLAMAASAGLIACLIASFVLNGLLESLLGREVFFTVFTGCAAYFTAIGLLPDSAFAQLASLLGN